jgi:hypothetical protein
VSGLQTNGVLIIVEKYTTDTWIGVLPAVILRVVLGGTVLFTFSALLVGYFPLLVSWIRNQDLPRDKDINVAIITTVGTVIAAIVTGVFALISGGGAGASP